MSENEIFFADDADEKNRVAGGTLYLVSTPIGNLADLSPRAVKVLSGVDFVAAEDTRNSGLLLSRFGIRRPLVSYYEHNKRERGEEILSRLLAGESCALVTDAGTPAVSDPGEDLVALCAAHGVPVTAVPGPVASVTALTLSGLSTARFCFEGFLPVGKAERHARLDALCREERTLLFHEAPHKLLRTLADLSGAFGPDRRVAVCRELTKRNEEILRTTLAGALAHFEQTEPRGEFVLVVEGAEAALAADWHNLTLADHVALYVAAGTPQKEAIKQVAHERGIPKNEVYQAMLKKEN